MVPTTDQTGEAEFLFHLRRVLLRERLTFFGAVAAFSSAASLPLGASPSVAAVAAGVGALCLTAAGALFLTEPGLVPLPDPPPVEEEGYDDDDDRPWN